MSIESSRPASELGPSHISLLVALVTLL